MKKTLHYLLIISTSFLFSALNAQELVYEQDHGVSFNKGTIDSDALIAIIQKKQEELNKFVLGRIVTKSWIDPKGSKNKLAADSSRLNNFTTKYLIYETLNELTITADKSKFGKNTLQLVKESAIIYGLAVVINDRFYEDYVSFNRRIKRHSTEGVVNEELLEDTISFNQTLDMVLNSCITNPAIIGYFPLFGRLTNMEDANRFWYENDSRYLSDKEALHARYKSVYQRVNSLFDYVGNIETITTNLAQLKKADLDSLFSITEQICVHIQHGDSLSEATLLQFKTCLKDISSLLPIKELNLIPEIANFNQKIDSVIKFVTSPQRIQQLNEITNFVTDLQQKYEALKKGDFNSILSCFGPQLTHFVTKMDGPFRDEIVFRLNDILTKNVDSTFRAGLTTLLNNGSPIFDVTFMTTFDRINEDYENSKLSRSFGLFDQSKVDAFLKALLKDRDGAPKKEYRRFKKNLKSQLAYHGDLTKGDILAALVDLKKNPKWKAVLEKPKFSSYKIDDVSMRDSLMQNLEKISNRISFVNMILQTLIATEKTPANNHFTFNEEQIDLTKDLMSSFIDYLDKSGRFSVASVYLRSIVDNVSYNEADSIEHKPATISLSFESVLYSLKDQLVKPSQLYRTRYFQPYINIGVNYSGFLFPNQLNVAEDGSTSTLKGMTFASEKIGFKYKIINREYTRSFKPGIVYKYYGHSWLWKRPQPQGLIDDLFLDIHTGGLLYNVVNLKTQDSFNFPYVGCGIGVRTFNGLTFSGAFNMPYTGNSFRKENAFITFGIDIPIIEYITAIRSR